jgi:hypothetical protein
MYELQVHLTAITVDSCNRHIPYFDSHGCDVVPGCVINSMVDGWHFQFNTSHFRPSVHYTSQSQWRIHATSAVFVAEQAECYIRAPFQLAER